MITINEFKSWARAHRSLARTVVEATALAQVERERVDAYLAPVFARFGFTDEDGAPIPDYRRLYLCRDEDEAKVREFYAAADAAHRAHGFTGAADECPALIAEWHQVQAENLLIDAAAPILGDAAGRFLTLDLRAKLLKTLLGACFANQ